MYPTTKLTSVSIGLRVTTCAMIARAAPGDVLNPGDFGEVRSDRFGNNNAGQATGFYETDTQKQSINLALRGTSIWVSYATALAVPVEADVLEYGVRINGRGRCGSTNLPWKFCLS